LEAALVAVLVAKLRRLIILVEKTRDRSILFIAATTEPLLTRALVERASRQTPAGRAGGPCVLRAGGGWVVWAVGACGRGWRAAVGRLRRYHVGLAPVGCSKFQPAVVSPGPGWLLVVLEPLASSPHLDPRWSKVQISVVAVAVAVVASGK
jgi:hypothetical protein